MDVLILGCNHLTTSLAQSFSEYGHRVTILSDNRECLEQVADDFPVEVIFTAEPLMQDYLQQGGVATTGVFLAMSSDDHLNALTAQIAQHIFRVPKVVCHVNDPQLQVLYSGLGLEVVGYSVGLLQDVRQTIER